MRGGFLHNQILVKRIEELALSRGARVQREAPTGRGRNAGFIDLLITYRDFHIAIEAERTAARVANDVRKALAVDADLLVIVMPTARDVRSARGKLRREAPNLPDLEDAVLVTTLGQAIQRLRATFGLLDTAECQDDQRSKGTKGGRPGKEGRP